MTILWEPDAQIAENVRLVLGAQVPVVNSAPAASRAVLDDAQVNLLVVGPDIDLSSALSVTQELRIVRPETGVILIRRRLDVALLSQASRAGVREVVAAEDLGELADACQRSRELSLRLGAATDDASEGRVVTVFSAKGGCGKTTVSTNLAAGLAKDGTRTLLVDLDLAFGDVAISLGLDPPRSMADLLAMAGHIDAEGLTSVVMPHGSGLDVLAAPKHPGDADSIPASLVGEALRVAKRLYDVVVVDTPPAFTEHVLAAFDVSDLTMVLATLDIPSVKNLALALETMDQLGLSRDLRTVVINRADAKNGLSVADVAAAIHHDVDAQIPESGDVTAATNKGVPIVLQSPRHPVSVAIRSLATARLLPPAPPASSALSPGRGARVTEHAFRSPFRRRHVAAGAEG